MSKMSLAGLNLNLLVSLDALLQERHVGRAARRVGVTQSAMSHTLRQLRALLDDPVLVRSGNDMLPTPTAERLHPRLIAGLSELNAVVSGRAAFDPAQLTDTFTLASHDGTATPFTPMVFNKLVDQAPGAHLRIAAIDTDAMAANLASGAWDVAVIPPLFPLEGLRSIPLGLTGIKVVCRRDHPRINKRLTLNAYCEADHLVVSLTGGGKSWVDDLLAQMGKERRTALRVPYLLAAAETLSVSDLVATLPDVAADYFCDRWPLKSFGPPFKMPTPGPLLMVWHPRFDAESAHIFFRELVREAGLTPFMSALSSSNAG